MNLIVNSILKDIFSLDLEKIKELQNLLNKFCETINKSKTDTKMLRALFKSGEYNSVADFLTKEKSTKDDRKYKALFYRTCDIKTYLELKEKFHISNEDFFEIIKEMQEEQE